MANPKEIHWKAMSRMVGYLRGKELYGLIFRSSESLTAIQYCNASYDTDTDTRKSVSGMISTVCGMIVNWSLHTQNVVQ